MFMAESFRIGSGFDVHAYGENRKMILCNVEIPSPVGLIGHSDADAALHALCDALLGAAALGDIGLHFPDTDEAYRNIDSSILLKHVLRLIQQEGFSVENIDLTIIAQIPKVAPYREFMRCRLSELLEIDRSCINIKATTTEGLGFIGRKEGLGAQAVVLLKRSK
jgi:2-C-methyl-D-erythritol 2,4-cyclodiphosphate synthase